MGFLYFLRPFFNVIFSTKKHQKTPKNTQKSQNIDEKYNFFGEKGANTNSDTNRNIEQNTNPLSSLIGQIQDGSTSNLLGSLMNNIGSGNLLNSLLNNTGDSLPIMSLLSNLLGRKSGTMSISQESDIGQQAKISDYKIIEK